MANRSKRGRGTRSRTQESRKTVMGLATGRSVAVEVPCAKPQYAQFASTSPLMRRQGPLDPLAGLSRSEFGH